MPIRLNPFVLGAAIVAGASTAAAQRPDFTGTWVRVDSVPGRTVAATGDAGFRRGDMGSGWGSPLTLAHAADRLTVVFDFFIPYDLQPKVRYAFTIGGAESRNTVNLGHATVEMRSSAAWKGDTLEIVTKLPAPQGVPARPNASDVAQRLWLDSQGRLTVEARRQGADALVSVLTTWTKR